MVKYICEVCGYSFDEEKEGKEWNELLDSFICPTCGASKDKFVKE